MRAAFAAIAAATCLLTACVQSSAPPSVAAQAPQPAIAEIAASFASYRKITPMPVLVNPELAMLCRGANASDVARARIAKGPHANTAVVIYMNEAAASTFTEHGATYRPGAVIVKQKSAGAQQDLATGRMIPSAANGVGGMVKRPPGFDPTHGDWEYFYFENPAKIETGRIDSCVQCHATAQRTDHVFGTWAADMNPEKQLGR